VPVVLLATDADRLHDEVDAALADESTKVERVSSGRDVLAIVGELDPDLVVLDLQIGNMGGMATCLSLRSEEGAGRLAPRPVLMLLDRMADVFLARRSDADGWLVKPLDALRLRRAAEALLGGGEYREGALVGGPGDALPENAVVPDQATPENPAEPEHAPLSLASEHTDAGTEADDTAPVETAHTDEDPEGPGG
jgi:DNA-binding response OmpR family regulator